MISIQLPSISLNRDTLENCVSSISWSKKYRCIWNSYLNTSRRLTFGCIQDVCWYWRSQAHFGTRGSTTKITAQTRKIKSQIQTKNRQFEWWIWRVCFQFNPGNFCQHKRFLTTIQLTLFYFESGCFTSQLHHTDYLTKYERSLNQCGFALIAVDFSAR